MARKIFAQVTVSFKIQCFKGGYGCLKWALAFQVSWALQMITKRGVPRSNQYGITALKFFFSAPGKWKSSLSVSQYILQNKYSKKNIGMPRIATT